MIGLFHGKANATTLPHEAAHWLLRMMEAMVKGGYADEQLQHEWETINRWLDRQKYEAAKDTPEYNKERAEKFARAFEQYIRTAKPPVSSVAIEGLSSVPRRSPSERRSPVSHKSCTKVVAETSLI